MKFLKYFIGIIIVLVIAFLALGLVKPVVSYECEITVGKTPAETWAVLQDPEKLPEWLPGFQRMEHVSGTPGTVGAVSMIYFDNEGESMAIKETITGMVPNESISMLYESDFMDMDYKLSITSIDGKTMINSITTAAGNGIFSKSIMALLVSSLKKQEETNLINLKKAIELNTTDYFQID
ncbi:MAG TPA: SRPBCC family protein [Cyclobacteriaceae bacterium]|nr:SRPBCC family protein [Cyclobacteriaceae bacterium]